MRKAIYDLNDYLLNGTPVGAMMGYTGTGLRPIIPIQQVPEFSDMDAEIPYIVYAGRSVPLADQWWISQDEYTYMIWGNDLDTINDLGLEIVDVCQRLDESADDLNKYLASVNRRDFIFHSVRVMGDLTPESAQSEGGRYGKPIIIRTEYVKTAGRGIA